MNEDQMKSMLIVPQDFEQFCLDVKADQPELLRKLSAHNLRCLFQHAERNNRGFNLLQQVWGSWSHRKYVSEMKPLMEVVQIYLEHVVNRTTSAPDDA